MARQQFVRLGVARGDFVAVLDGVKPGQTLVTVGAFKLRNNAGIVINNDIKATPSLAPHVDNL
jgi:membrane fusion protein (multidrug efflux system)